MRASNFLRLAYLLPAIVTRVLVGQGESGGAVQSICLPDYTWLPYFLVAAALCFLMRSRPLKAKVIVLALQPLLSLVFVWSFLTQQVQHEDPASLIPPLLLAGYAHAVAYLALFALGVRFGVWREYRVTESVDEEDDEDD